ncbi:MAG TPA: hypothetical protein VK714_12740 [Myxococcota bacterium]|nr:hypothetical protein [Myxococcota bacterium]
MTPALSKCFSNHSAEDLLAEVFVEEEATSRVGEDETPIGDWEHGGHTLGESAAEPGGEFDDSLPTRLCRPKVLTA